CLRRGLDARTEPMEKHRGPDLTQLAARAVFVDEDGVGAGVVDRLRQLGLPFVFGINFGGAAERWGPDGAKPLYANKRAEMWGNLREWLADASLPDDPELRADLSAVEYGYNGKGEIQLEKKEDMKKRGLASPDIGDALALTFALPVTNAAWDLPRGQAYYKTDYDLFAEFDEDYWYGQSS
ncbi:MAG: terminase, partial [Reyranella sp.]|nr:terminase [Reyranella sp.]